MDALISSLDAVGGSLAVAFIISLAAGIVAMTLVYLGSALLVLDRFARVARGFLGTFLAGIVVALGAALMATLANFPADAVYEWVEWRESFARHLLLSAGSAFFFIAIAKSMTLFLSQGTTSRLATGAAALAVSLTLASTGPGSLPAATFGVTLVLALILRGLRAIRGTGEASTAETLLFVAALGLLPGVLVGVIPVVGVQSAAAAGAAGG